MLSVDTLCMANTYRVTTAKPVSLPEGVNWEYAEIPQELAYLRPDLPVAAGFGVIVTDRPLTKRECGRKVEVA
jgi:hypothetical protein